MSERTFTYTWTDAKRLTVLHALGFMLVRLETDHTPPAVTEVVLDLVGELSRSNGADSTRAPAPAPAPNAEIMRGTTLHDYFATDRKGNVPLNAPAGAELQTIPIVSAQEKPDAKGKHLQVIFGEGRGKANCFDPQLWPHIKKAQGHEAQLWMVESGNYLNIVGVRA